MESQQTTKFCLYLITKTAQFKIISGQKKKSNNHLMSHSTNRSITEPINQSINQSVNQPITHSTNPTTDWPTNQFQAYTEPGSNVC